MLLDIGNVDVSRVNGVIGLMLLDAANYYLVLKQVLHGLSLMVSLFMLQSFGLMQHLQLMMSFSSSRSLGIDQFIGSTPTFDVVYLLVEKSLLLFIV